ncbi:MAG TPA: hypothetical protein VEK73_17955 [Xanthobacteraceae bacterium]|nr:hypothetical protein [Xanthobacteraceae bacterium]
MPAKTQILDRLGESAVLLPDLIAGGLAANDRAKLRLTMLQEAVAHGQNPTTRTRDLTAERRRTGLDDAQFDDTVGGARLLGAGRFAVAGSRLLLEGLFDDLEAMRAPLAAAPDGQAFAARLAALRAAAPSPADDIVAAADISALTQARPGGADSVHRLIMDLHKAINRLAAVSAVETIDGAHVHRVGAGDRGRIAAFMRGLNRTARLAFGHPGLGTTATRSGDRLVIQNDIGTTDAHVLVVHVEGNAVTVTYTDVHRPRAKFFISMFAGRDIAWSQLGEDGGLGKEGAFFLVTGTYKSDTLQALDEGLEFLGSRIVFLIDWNKARKALQTFAGKRAVVEVLEWAATHDFGHRAFLELGGAELVFEAVRRVAAGRVPYGARLDNVLGGPATAEFLKSALRIASEGLSSGHSARLIRDEIQAELTQCFETAENALYAVVLRHLGLSRMLAGLICDAMAGGQLAGAEERAVIAAQSKRLEHKADRLALEAREIAQRLVDDRGHLRPAADAVEQATDALDDAAFVLSLFPDAPVESRLVEPLAAIAEIATASVGDLVRSIEAAARLPEGIRVDAVAALQAIDAVIGAEKTADDRYRAAVAAMLASPGEANLTFIAIELARALESATDHLARAALSLRERVIEELSA